MLTTELLIVPLIHAGIVFGSILIVMAVLYVAAIIYAKKRQEKWLKQALPEAILQTTPAYINRKKLKRIK